MATCERSVAAAAEVATWKSQLLPEFGLQPLELSHEMEHQLPFLPLEKHTCASCSVRRVRCAFRGGWRDSDRTACLQSSPVTTEELEACYVCLDSHGCTDAHGKVVHQRVTEQRREGFLSILQPNLRQQARAAMRRAGVGGAGSTDGR